MIPGADRLRFDRMPPVRVPMRAFLAAPFLGAAGGVLLAGTGPTGRFAAGLIGALHLVTLGFLTLVMVGAFFQVLPVVTGVPVPGARVLGPAIETGVGLGALAVGFGLAMGARSLLGVGVVVLAVAVAGFSVVGLVATWRARRNPTGRAMGLAVASLVVVAALGLLLLAGHAGWVPLRRDLTDVHLAWALAGWVASLVMGVSFQVIPMFQVTPAYPRWAEVLPLVVVGGLVVWTAGRTAGTSGIAVVGGGVVAVGLTAYAVATLVLLARRRRKLADVTTDAWRVSMASLAAVGIVGLLALGGLDGLGTERATLGFGAVAVFGFAVTVVEGMLYKIVPFLSWLHLQNLVTEHGLAGRVRIRNLRRLLPAGGARRQFRVHLLALGIVLVAAVAGGPWVRFAGVALAVDFALLGWELAAAVRRAAEDRAVVAAAVAGINPPPGS